MPTQWAHSHYWGLPSGPPPGPGVSTGGGGYPAWQSAVTGTYGSGFGGLHGALSDAWAYLAWWAHWVRQVWHWRHDWRRERIAQDERAVVLDRCRSLLLSDHYAPARGWVRDTAMTLGFNKPEAWVMLAKEFPHKHAMQENAYRHLRAVHKLTPETAGLPSPERHLLVELAYLGYALRPRE